MFIIQCLLVSQLFYYIDCFSEKYIGFSRKEARNSFCFIHAIISAILNNLFIYCGWFKYTSLLISKGYFLYDLYYIIRFDKKTNMNLLYIYHHSVSLYILYRYPDWIHIMLALAETSNLPYFLIYHYLHQPVKPLNKINNLKIIQKYVYGLLRGPFATFLFMYHIQFDFKENKDVYFVLFPLYIMGIIHTINLIK